MSRHRLYHHHPKVVRDKINQTQELAQQILKLEDELVVVLSEVDQHQYYVRVGYHSLMGFCNLGLKFSRTQSQRIATRVRRYVPTANFEHSREANELTDLKWIKLRSLIDQITDYD